MREMKDSGIEWIGEIPKHWKCCKVKNSTSFVGSGTTPTSSNQDFYDGDINWIQSGDLYKTVVVDTVEKKLTEKALKSFSALHIYQAPFIVMAMYGASVGNTAFSKIDACCNQACCCIKNNEFFDLKFMYYWLDFAQIDFLGRAIGGTQPNISQDKIKNQYIVKPSLEEQQQITDFLDTQCSEIDATAEDIQKEISLLEDYKKSVITEAVTKGLNPDAEMKDSKIFYLGQINKTWNLTKVGYCCKKLYRPFEPSDEALVCSNKGKVVPRGDTLIGLMTSDDNAMQGICKGDIAIHGMDTWHGAIACSEYDGKITRVVHVCKADGDNRFVVYWLQHLAFVGVYKLISNGVRGNTSDFRSWDKVADIYVPNPIKEEQQQIVDYLDTKCSEIDTLIADKKRQLDIIAEYKKSLIYEYVTGKKEVPVNE